MDQGMAIFYGVLFWVIIALVIAEKRKVSIGNTLLWCLLTPIAGIIYASVKKRPIEKENETENTLKTDVGTKAIEFEPKYDSNEKQEMENKLTNEMVVNSIENSNTYYPIVLVPENFKKEITIPIENNLYYSQLELKKLEETKPVNFNDFNNYELDENENPADFYGYNQYLKYVKRKSELENKLWNEYFKEKVIELVKPLDTFELKNDCKEMPSYQIKFLGDLIKFFEDAIKINRKLGKYCPSYFYEYPDYSMLIVIEIDEKYLNDTKEPIHFIGSSDKEFNNYFINMNIGIIRFTKYQVEQSPVECCEFIKETINDIVNIYYDKKEIELPLIKRWTYEEAFFESHLDLITK